MLFESILVPEPQHGRYFQKMLRAIHTYHGKLHMLERYDKHWRMVIKPSCVFGLPYDGDRCLGQDIFYNGEVLRIISHDDSRRLLAIPLRHYNLPRERFVNVEGSDAAAARLLRAYLHQRYPYLFCLGGSTAEDVGMAIKDRWWCSLGFMEPARLSHLHATWRGQIASFLLPGSDPVSGAIVLSATTVEEQGDELLRHRTNS